MEDLYHSIKEFFPDFDVSMKDLANPTQFVVLHFFRTVLGDFNIEVDNIMKPHVMQGIDDEVNDILPFLNMLSSIKTAFPFLDIGLFDLISPTPKRCLMHMRKVMTVMQFCEKCLEKLNLQVEPQVQAEEELRALREERENLIMEQNRKALQKDKMLQTKAELEANILKKRQEYQLISQAKNSLSAQRDEIKAIVLEKENSAEAILSEMKSIDGDIENLMKQIVDLPEISHADIEAQMEEKMNVEKVKGELWERIKEKQKVKSHFQLVLDVVKTKLEDMKEVIVLIEKYLEVKDEKCNLEKEDQQLLAEKEALVKQLSHLNEACEKEEINLKILQSEMENKLQELSNDLNENQRCYVDEVKVMKTKKDEIDKYNKELEELEKKIETCKIEYETTKKCFNEALTSLNNKKASMMKFYEDKLETIKSSYSL